MQSIKRSVVLPAFALALSVLGAQAYAQNQPSTNSGSASSNQEVRRGVPGVDVDVNTRDRGPNAGVPGVDVDVRNTRRNQGDPDTSAQRNMGNNGGADTRAVRADRN